MKKIYFLFLMALLPIVTYADPVEINGIYYNIVKKTKKAEVTSNPNSDYYSGSYSGNVVIPNTVTYEGVVCNVTSVGERAFCYCSVTSVTIPNSVTSIGENAFYYCSDLTSVTIPNSVTSIGGGAFKGCSGLTSVTIPNSVTSIGYSAFEECTRLTAVHITDLEAWCKISFSDNPLRHAHHLYLNGTEIKDLVIPNSVTSIGGGAFKGCSGLTSVTIPNSVTSIGDYAFIDCTGLSSVTIPNSVTSIGYRAFDSCMGMTSVTIPNSVTSIGRAAFLGCSGMTSVTIGDGLTSIEKYTFCDCSSLTSVTIPNSVTSIDDYAFYNCSGMTSVTIGNGVTSIDNYAFTGCKALTSVHISDLEAWCKIHFGPYGSSPLEYAHHLYLKGTEIIDLVIPNSVKYIDAYAFQNCSSLKSVTIPNMTVTEDEDEEPGYVEAHAFSGCSNLTTITIGKGIEGIGQGAFANCPELTDVYCYAENVPETDKDAFEDSYIEYATLHVPAGSVDAYKAKTPWSGFKEKVAIAATVKLNKTKATIEKTKTLTLKATVTPSDLLDKSVTWKSSNTAVATVTSSGKVKGVKAGTATITCTSNLSGSKTTCKVTVGYVKLDQTEATITKGLTLTLTPTVYPSSLTDKSVTWKSSNTAVATVSGDGTVKGIKAGTATITCTSNATGLSTTCAVTVINGSITLNKSEAALEKGKTMTLKATLTPSDLSDKSVTWKSSNTKVATVSSSGKVTAVKTGTATITCTSAALGLSATCKVTVGKVTLDMTEMILKKGKTETLTATVYPSSLEDKSVAWKSSDTNIATVTSAGKVKGIKDGTVTITCTSNATGLKATCTVKVVTGSVTLDKSEAAVQKGKTLTLTATVTPTTLEDKSVTWTSSNTEVATVSSTGKVKGVKYGTATITCTSNATGLSATCQVTVGKVIISMSEFTLKKSRGITLEAIVYPSTLADKSVIWESSDTEVATVTSEGRVKGIKAGTATITCTSVATGLKGTCTVTVLSTSGGRSVEGNDDTTGIENLENAPALTEPYDVYDLSGRKVRHQVNSLDGLPDGIYIVNGRKILKK